MTDWTKAEETTFWSKANVGPPGDCWEWQGVRSIGYGRINIRKTKMWAHRMAWELAHGPIPDGLEVCHRCDNRPCVNPDHLFLGTHAENMADMRTKGRMKLPPVRRGMANNKAKLKPEQVRAIRRERAAGDTMVAIAERYGIGHTQVRNVVSGRQWRHVND